MLWGERTAGKSQSTSATHKHCHIALAVSDEQNCPLPRPTNIEAPTVRPHAVRDAFTIRLGLRSRRGLRASAMRFFVARFAPQEIQTHSQEFAELGEHFVLKFENSSIQISPNETETNTLFQIGLTSCSMPLGFRNLVSPRIHFSSMF